MKVGLVRRGYSASGGAENYLKRFAQALTSAGQECALFASEDWPQNDWPFGAIHRVRGATPRAFADAREALRSETRARLGLAKEDFVLLFAGSGWERKGLRFAIEGINAAALSGPVLLVAGRGNSRAMPCSNRVRFLGPVRDMPAILA